MREVFGWLTLSDRDSGRQVISLRVTSCLVALEVRDDVAPLLVIVDAQRDNKTLACIGHDAKGARGPASAHLKHVATIDLAPTVGVLPDGLLGNMVVRVLAGSNLMDIHLDRVTHYL